MAPANGPLDGGFDGLIPQTDDDVRGAMVGGLLSLDANVLLNFYRYSPNAQSALLEVLRAVGDRVWVSHQAAREFWRNRCAAIDDRNKATEDVRRTLQDNEKKTLHGLDVWAKQTAVPAEIKDRVRGRLKAGFSEALELIDAEAGQAGRVTYGAATDSVVIMLRELLQGKVGPRLPKDEHQNAVVEARRRVISHIPPGYKDAEKEGGPGEDGASGDYLVWYQSVLEAKLRDLPLVIVTGDEKEDWWWRHRNILMGPRSELIDEFSGYSEHGLFLIRPVQLIEHAAVLDVTVSEEAASDVARGSIAAEEPRWSAEAVRELLRRLDVEGAVQAEVIRFAASQGGLIDREKVYEIGDFHKDRMLRGFTRPTARITRDLQSEGLLDEGVEPMLTPVYQDVIAIRFEIPLDVVEILAADTNG
ncbi:PIN-like domain-containing protein [Amycolatopsis decaplanina]|uniref:PIN like domain-containing protein n=1 Tax=Amycolatopsis decaplanina DSM 44594 TaxID=1284240 RepID=M2ZSD8_9PSEU|nr:PIN-like domain-containing protein [Amycolatopsis decaplanina]EME63698.1 hypothetical protein H074_03754 [Amycolatopsis decaplanina DSM 44594]